MKASSFMIGDIVNVYPSNLPIHIAAVHNRKVAYHSVEHRLEWVRESLLRPIPLTPEILEKNGFVKDNDGEMSWCSRLGYCIPDEYENSKVKSWTLQILGNFNSFNGSISFVHELQHAMRLCGIEKDIQL